MTKPQKDAPAAATAKLAPVVVKKEKDALAAAGTRKRPVLAINDEGQLVVCSRRTASKKGWEVKNKVEAAAPVAPAKQERRSTDKPGQLKAVAEKLAEGLADVLGTPGSTKK